MTINEMEATFSRRVFEIRLRENMPLKELSQRSGVSLEILEALEEGILPEEITVGDVFNLANALKCRESELFL